MVATILSVVGARPNFLKLAPLQKEFLKHPSKIKSLVIHTGQHYDHNMSSVFFQDLELPQPDFYLDVGSASHSVQTARVMMRFEEVVQQVKPSLVVVFGDVNSTLGCALVCAKERIPLAHIEAGLRSFDHNMPEEINRLLTDQVAELLFVTEQAGVDNLLREGVQRDRIFLVGNVMIDALTQFWEKAQSQSLLKNEKLSPKSYFLMTMHRAGNVDSEEKLGQLIDLLNLITKRAQVLFPVHPRTSRNLERFGLTKRLTENTKIKMLEPLSYLSFLNAAGNALAVLSDSGGVQAETTHLNVPCLTFRETTEQPVTVSLGTNTLVGLKADQILPLLDDILVTGGKKSHPIPLWDGNTSVRITEVLLECFSH